MRVCPNCSKELADGIRFCDACGTPIPEAPAPIQEPAAEPVAAPLEQEPIATPAENISEEPLHQEAAPAATGAAQENALLAAIKKVPKKIWIIAGAAVAAVALIILVCCLIFGGKAPKYALYLKDNELFYSDLTKGGSFQVSDRLLADVSDDFNAASSASGFSLYNALCDNGNRLFYLDRLEEDSDGASIYYRDLDDAKAESVKIDSGIRTYAVNEKGTRMIYLKSSGDLYLHDMKDKEKLANEVSGFTVSKDLKKVIYQNEENSLYLWKDGSAEKIVSNVTAVKYISEDLSVVYYTKDEALYKWSEKSGEKDKLLNEYAYIVTIYESGEIYYLTSSKTESTVMDYVVDNLAESDAAMTQPESPARPSYPTYPSRPSSPYYSQYSTTEEYEAAYAQYEIDLAAYQAEYDRIKQEYNAAMEQYYADYEAYEEAYDAWWDKRSRDYLRESLEGYTLSSSSYTLHYYKDGESTQVAENVSNYYSVDTAADTAVALFECNVSNAVEKLKLSEIESAYDAYVQIRESLDAGSEYTVAIGKNASALDEENVQNISLCSDGKVLYFLRDVNEEKQTGELCKIHISGGELGKTESCDTDVSISYIRYSNGSLLYYKDFNNETMQGDLYMDGENIDYDVYAGGYALKDGKLLYCTDYNAEKSMGTLKIYKKGDRTKIADDVYDFRFAADGAVLYIYDYSLKSSSGTLYSYKNGKAEKLDEDVNAFIYVYAGILKGAGAIYGW